jgi:hypothetical protein
MTPGKLEMVIKINALPEGATTNAHGWRTFSVDCEGTRVEVTVRPKMWTKLEEAAKNWPSWVGAITGKVGVKTAEGFVLAEPAIQVFERKPKAEPAPAAG